ncbi:hypothetical protein GPECTOR_605g682 [Gonium pectorale]|uniref:Uncharacterized protein n=1 Tax=Gonium pectorale TaxID=33097 RepID=A0A150FUD7_GONPE|nr:hypothetical protein GPECTOR_605g682 [Gonium pectorale]|eukprot:KXZ41253.1 hypothetical protein GPECTOR_605g682 [Gonium pectorale]
MLWNSSAAVIGASSSNSAPIINHSSGDSSDGCSVTGASASCSVPPAALVQTAVELSFVLKGLLVKSGVQQEPQPKDLTQVGQSLLVEMLRSAGYLQGDPDLSAMSDPTVHAALNNLYMAATRLPAEDDRPLPLMAVAGALSGGSHAVLCPLIDVRSMDDSTDRLRRVVTTPGCPCTFAPPPDDGRLDYGSACPAGYVCSRKAFRGLPTDDPTAVQLRAVCVPCLSGKYCPEGTTGAQVGEMYGGVAVLDVERLDFDLIVVEY